MKIRSWVIIVVLLVFTISLTSCLPKQDASEPSQQVVLERNTTITNPLITSLWDGTTARVPAELDIEAFFGQECLPYLWEGEEYKSYIDSQDDPQQLLRFHWASALMFHPDSAVVVATLRFISSSEPDDLQRGSALFLADLLAGNNQEIAVEASKLAWKLDSNSLEYVLTVLLSKGAIPSGIPLGSADRGMKLLQESCPPSREDDLNGLLGIAKTAPSDEASELPVLGDYDHNIVCFSESLGSTSDANARNVAVDDTGRVYVVWHDERLISDEHPMGKEIFLRYFDGAKWEDEVQLTSSGLQSTCPSIASRAGRTYVVFTEAAASNPWLDYYQGFLVVYELCGSMITGMYMPSESLTAGDADLAIAADGTVHVVWNDYRSGEWEIYYAAMTPEGMTSPEERVSRDPVLPDIPASVMDLSEAEPAIEDQVRPSVNVDSDGNIYVVWLSRMRETLEIGQLHELCYAVRTETGWSRTFILTVSFDVLLYPSSCIDESNRLHITYGKGITTRSGAYDDKLFYTRADASGRRTEPQLVFDVPGRYSDVSSVAVDSQGIVHVVWSEAEGPYDMDIFYARGGSEGFDYVGRITDDDRYSGCPTITLDKEDHVHAVWTDNHDGLYHIYYFEIRP